ncbi:Zinc finger RING-CH-type [Penicillium frequentans]|uniref:Zinc finger RING-CH-type n=1 Tax=Penicillium frequentans TaxID=3151616 RepID=A0AAD6CXG5_9EURO|nr:Zinc finger RING-CH-type [Penicillium glabrum]
MILNTLDGPPSNESDSPGLGTSEQSYSPRVCRICLETVWPTVQPSEFLQRPRLVYESSDPESGRLLRPCKCKGSSRYVHEGCLQSWRHANPGYGTRNYWECPTCGFQYRLERLTWARWISSTATQMTLTLAILLLTIFLLGFVADPVIELYVGPLDDEYLELDEDASWLEHFVKGFAALGLTSFLRALFTLSPPFWIRGSGVVSNGRSTGRNRAANLNWLVIVAGVATFLWTVYKGVRSWSKRTLQWAGEKVMDVPLPEDEDEDELVPNEPSTHPKTE